MNISIVIPCFNAAAFLPRCLDSLLAQTHQEWEAVCVDDRSTDSTWEVLCRYSQKDRRVRVLQLEENSGSAKYPRDFAISQATGEWICNVDADDYVEADYLGKLAARQQESGAELVLSRLKYFEGREDSGRILRSNPLPGFDMSQLMTGRQAFGCTLGLWRVGANGMLARRELWEASPMFMERSFTHMNADELEFRAVMAAATRVALAEAQYFYRKYPGSITAIPARSYEMLLTQQALLHFIRGRYGTDCAEYRAALAQCADMAAFAVRTLNRQTSVPADAWQLIRRMYYTSYGRPVLHAYQTWRMKLAMFLPFGAYRLVMKAYYRLFPKD